MKISTITGVLIAIIAGNVYSGIENYQQHMLGNDKAKFIEQTISDQSKWFKLLSEITEGVTAGDVGWLSIASEFYSETDAGESLSINISISKALPYSPAVVLNAPDYGFKLERLCMVPFIEADDATIEAFMAEASAALGKLAAEGNARAKECLDLLVKS